MLGGAANISFDCSDALGHVESPCVVSSPASAPVLPMATTTVRVHTIVDHEIVETIVNNRTAMVTYHEAIPSEDSTAVALFGVTEGIQATIETWNLDAANNL